MRSLEQERISEPDGTTADSTHVKYVAAVFDRRHILMKPSTKTPELQIQFTKRIDGSVSLRCVRRDGTATWERHEKHAAFYAFHDLRHFAVETVLAQRSGFYGLIADGWDISDTTGKGKRGKLSATSLLVEHIVGLLDRERAGGAQPLSAAEFNEQLDTALGPDPSRPRFSDEQLDAVRNRTDELHRQWAEISPGSSLNLTFARD